MRSGQRPAHAAITEPTMMPSTSASDSAVAISSTVLGRRVRIMTRLPSTVLLMATALSLALVLGIIVGSVMAAWAGRWPDRMLSVVVLLFYSMPGFWVGLMAIVLFSVKLGWLPSDGSMTIGANLSGFAFLSDRLEHLILPALA